jgi:FHS family L-fucose permease-like MFS transporter
MANTIVSEIIIKNNLTQTKDNKVALISLAVLYFMMGFITCLNDTLVPFFRRGFSLTYSESSLVQFYFFITYAIVSIPSGKIVERIGYKNGMVAGFSISACGALLFYPAAAFHAYILFLAALFILAIGIVLLQVAANPYITILGPAKTASSRLTLIQGIGSIGTTTAPLFGAYFILSHIEESTQTSKAVQFPYIGIAASLIFIAVIVFRLRLPDISPGNESSKSVTGKKKQNIFSFRNLNFGVWAIFVYVGAEVAIGTFLTNYIADTLKIPEQDANKYVAFYWGGMLVGRLLGSIILRYIRSNKVLSFNAIISIILIFISVNSSNYTAVWSMISIGFFNSVMFATIFSLSVFGLGKHTTTASGLLSTAIVGGAIIPYLQGILKDNFTWYIAFMIPVACYIYLLFFGLNGYKVRKKN